MERGVVRRDRSARGLGITFDADGYQRRRAMRGPDFKGMRVELRCEEMGRGSRLDGSRGRRRSGHASGRAQGDPGMAR